MSIIRIKEKKACIGSGILAGRKSTAI